MPDLSEWWIFLGTATLIAVAPGPGILYVLARSLHGGRAEGVRSALGTFLGAAVHVLAATIGLSALLATSALAFTVVKFLGAAYLIYLGARTLWELRGAPAEQAEQRAAAPKQRGSAVTQGLVTEVLNPKTAMFFLAFIPQFVHPERGSQSIAFLALGLAFVVLASTADLLVAVFAGSLGTWIANNPRWQRRQHAASGTTLIGLGGALALSQQ
ncbi:MULTISPECIES: LysE family translocator [Actinopolyspora]|uniref:Threonine/homoserine/homoserine lactone efflux protein n=1 Tax=Actinopolyspora saharensis TaxID=995062 RepID=A0A1H1FWG6_9ACTN|nr:MULTISPECIES: LysE family translocator [Actinopolyspora]NHD16193.1 LysE family translocator [Actinopolyspora sp. BKK2]NHE75944.1 LysE family translocator [Actinopolyspora sp. BKK1]SDR04876.1 Threonine/homoserine/homoserine lactone efflux protein [Actinopolyspora saharensis]